MFKKQFYNVPSVLYQNRCCSQENFDIIANAIRYDDIYLAYNLIRLHYTSLYRIDPIITYGITSSISVVTSSDVYRFCGKDGLNVYRYEGNDNFIHKYYKKIELPENAILQFFCSFMKNLFVYIKSQCKPNIKYCLMYNIQTSQWTYIADTNSYREKAACTIFEGKIVVSGGECGFSQSSKTVESYDYYEDCWTYLPDMIESRCDHGAVSIDNKMFVIGGNVNSSCEVFDSTSRKFTYIKNMFVNYYDSATHISATHVRAVGIDRKIIVFPELFSGDGEVHIFDTLTDNWYIRTNFLNGVKSVISCSKLPTN